LSILGNLVLMPGSILDIELAGTAPTLFDVLNVSGSAAVAGTLNVLQFGNYVAAVGDSFAILNANSVSGTFGSVVSPGAFAVNTSYGAASITLSVPLSTTTLPPVDPSVFVDFSGLPNTGSGIGSENNAGTSSNTQTTTTFNALLESAPSAAIGIDGLTSELYLGEPLTGEARDARLLCR
jgi:hypothetical protein